MIGPAAGLSAMRLLPGDADPAESLPVAEAR
jgi:hypothetical protein